MFAQSSWKRGWWIPVSQGMCLGQKTSLRALSTSFKALFSPKTTRKQTRCHGNQVTLLSKLQFITIYEQNIDKKTILPKNWIIKDVNTSKKIFRQFLIKIAFFLYSTTLRNKRSSLVNSENKSKRKRNVLFLWVTYEILTFEVTRCRSLTTTRKAVKTYRSETRR